ncbi:tectonin beta-propeller repeat-containing protein 1-like isoform X2 [Ornithodoros turicata]|uniref:tectonin beta-propeller repeat-containing protein 1-like isoform X2 n=1 Tax=Ornithodoros turicata TaxID=34597 RepID=UPI003138EC21
MPSSNLWAVNNTGNAFTLSTAGNCWRELPHPGVDLQRVSAVQSAAWGIGSDQHVYTFVPYGDKIRVPEVTYENQRWGIKEGYCTPFLPTDRPHWSSEDGLSARPKESITLRSGNWEWEDCWHIDGKLDGVPLKPEGWAYCLGFPYTYTPRKKWNSFVRRRKWIRNRHYTAFDKWAKIANGDLLVDVAAGGERVPGSEPDSYAVWVVNDQGKAAFRSGVSRLNPEGDSWIDAVGPQNMDVIQISVGLTGLTWAVAGNGSALVRTGVSKDNYMGTGWTEVPAPQVDQKLAQVAVGPSSVWAISRYGTVWFRYGIEGEDLGCLKSITGSGWIEVATKMVAITVGPNNQVWGIRRSDHRICLRTGVTREELSGRGWKELTVTTGKPQSTTSSLQEQQSDPDSGFFFVVGRSPQGAEDVGDDSANAYGTSELQGNLRSRIRDDGNITGTGKFDPADCVGSINWTWVSGSACTIDYLAAPSAWFTSGDPSNKRAQERPPGRIAVLCRLAQRRIRVTDALKDGDAVDMQSIWVKTARPLICTNPLEQVQCTLELESSIVEGVESVAIRLEYTKGEREEKMFLASRSSPACRHNSRARVRMFLRDMLSAFVNFFFKVSFLFFFFLRNSSWDTTTNPPSLSMTINVADVTCVAILSPRDQRTLGVWIKELSKEASFLRFVFLSDAELEDWTATLNLAANNLRGDSGPVTERAIWGLTHCGDVYVQSIRFVGKAGPSLSGRLWRHLGGGHFRVVESCPHGITWALGHDNRPWVYTGGYGGGVYQGFQNQGNNVHPMTDRKTTYVYENQRWSRISGFAAKHLPKSRPEWSDDTGLVECTKDSVKLDSIHWLWTTDWAVDNNVPGGADDDGWQYACASFLTGYVGSYHSGMRSNDTYRRRRWFRLSKLNTSGPWREVEASPGPIRDVTLKSISLQMDYGSTSQGSVALWAVTTDGRVLYRGGVTRQCPQGELWRHVPFEVDFESISVGSGSLVLAIDRHGIGYVRRGISDAEPIGTIWSEVQPPTGSRLSQVSAGHSGVCAVDTVRRLWYHADVTQTVPEGDTWHLVSEGVSRVSVGPNDQVLAIIDVVESGTALTNVVARRLGMTRACPSGTGWETGFAVEWSYISARGCSY